MDQDRLFARLVRQILCERPDASFVRDLIADLDDLCDALERRFAPVNLARVAAILRREDASLLARSALVDEIVDAVRAWNDEAV